MTRLEAFLGRGQKEIPCPGVGELVVGRLAGPIHRGQIECEIFLEQVDPGRGRQGRAADTSRYRNPVTLLLGDIFDAGADLAVLGDQRRHDVVDRFEVVGLSR